MLKRPRIVVPAFLAVQAFLVYLLAGQQQLPEPPRLSRLPATVQDWSELREEPLDAEIVNELHADRLLNRLYVNRTAGSLASLFIAWFQSQRGGQAQPHSPKVCLPGSGWVPQQSGDMNIDTSSGPMTVNRYLVSDGSERAVVLYWYQTPRRVVAGEWASKFWLIVDGMRDQRTDTALVRIVIRSGIGGDQAATRTAASFAQKLYPLLREQLPH